MATLYRKYRPMTFAEVVNQNHIKVTLEHQLESGQLAHAYLFCGPRAVGKTTLARVLAKAANCQKRAADGFEPCNGCPSCTQINAGRHLDVLEIDAASHTGVDNVRENIIAAARTAPSTGKFKVFIIDEVHMLTGAAFNALLKIIEEPPAYVIFVLCTTEVHKVPLTVISRCQRFDFKRLSVTDIVKKLLYIVKEEKIEVDAAVLEAIARHADGYMRDAESLFGQVVAVGGKKITAAEADLVIPRSDLGEVLNFIEMLANKDAAGGIRLVNKLLDEGVSLKQFIFDCLEVLRKIMLGGLSPALLDKFALDYGEQAEARIAELSKLLGLDYVMAAMDKLATAAEEMKTSHIVQLPLELAVTRLSLSGKAAGRASGAPLPPSAPGTRSAAPASGPPADAEGMKIKDIVDRWPEVLSKVKQHNHSLSFILRICQPRAVEGGRVCIAFKYKFHKDRLGDATVRAILERILKEVYGSPLLVDAIVDETISVEESNGQNNNGQGGNNNLINDILKTFGGKIIK